MKKRKGMKQHNLRCPYCGSGAVYRSADGIYRENKEGIMLYVCSKYPECDAYVRVHKGTKIPMGELADRELRNLRREAHYYFDQLYQTGIMTRDEAYRWLADQISAPMSEAHFGHMGVYYCKEVIKSSKELLKSYQKDKKHARFKVYKAEEVC